MLIARSIEEAGLYVDLHPCDCGAPGELSFSLIERDGEPIAVYEGTCAGCGKTRRFEFSIPAEVVPSRAYGGAEPSSIIDPGEFLWYSDQAADRAAASSGAREKSALDTAIAALDEVLKFIPPGANAVPHDAITSDQGRTTNPDRFTRDRLTYRRNLLQAARAQA